MEKLIAARGNGYASIERLAAVAGVSRFTIERLAEADAFRSLGLDRRAALWAARRLDTIGIRTAPAAAARRQSEAQTVRCRCSPPHMSDDLFPGAGGRACRHAALRACGGGLRGDRPVAEGPSRALLPRPPHARSASCATWSTAARSCAQDQRDHRRRPRADAADGRAPPRASVFMTLEDETDIANIIVWPKVFARTAASVMTSRFLAVRGRLQRAGLVVHVVAESFVDLSAELPLAARGRRSVLTEILRRPAAAGHAVPTQEPGFSLAQACPGRSAARSETECCAADPGSSETPSLRRSRISGAAFHAARVRETLRNCHSGLPRRGKSGIRNQRSSRTCIGRGYGFRARDFVAPRNDAGVTPSRRSSPARARAARKRNAGPPGGRRRARALRRAGGAPRLP